MALKVSEVNEKLAQVWSDGFTEAQRLIGSFWSSPEAKEACLAFSRQIVKTLKGGGRIYTCGNGGSYCDALHFAEELTGRYRKDRRPLPAMALGEGSHATCVANDFGFEFIFSRQIEAFGRPGDLLLSFSTSGKSKNVLNAIRKAKELGVYTVSLLGRDGGPAASISDLPIIVPAETSDRIQEVHLKLVHLAIETTERELFPENYL